MNDKHLSYTRYKCKNEDEKNRRQYEGLKKVEKGNPCCPSTLLEYITVKYIYQQYSDIPQKFAVTWEIFGASLWRCRIADKNFFNNQRKRRTPFLSVKIVATRKSIRKVSLPFHSFFYSPFWTIFFYFDNQPEISDPYIFVSSRYC